MAAVSCIPVGDIWLNETKHLLGGLGDFDEDTVVDLEQSEELEDLAGFGGDFVDTTNTNDEVNLRLCGHVEVTRSTGSTLQPNLLFLLSKVLLHMSLSTLEDNFALRLGGLFGKGGLVSTSFCK